MTAAASLQARAEAAKAPATVDPRNVIKQLIGRYELVIARLLNNTGIDKDTFKAQIQNACRATPKLWECDPETVIGAALKCAQLGLAPNDSRNLAWIIPYGKQATFQRGYGGIMELARRALPGLRFDGRPVYPNDEFDVDYGLPNPLRHRDHTALRLDRGGQAFAWYVRAMFPDGQINLAVLDREGVEYHRSFSQNKNGGMWKDNYDAAALKSVVHDMARFLPSSPASAAAAAADGAVISVRTIDEDDEYTEPLAAIETGETEPANEPEPAA